MLVSFEGRTSTDSGHLVKQHRGALTHSVIHLGKRNNLMDPIVPAGCRAPIAKRRPSNQATAMDELLLVRLTGVALDRAAFHNCRTSVGYRLKLHNHLLMLSY